MLVLLLTHWSWKKKCMQCSWKPQVTVHNCFILHCWEIHRVADVYSSLYGGGGGKGSKSSQIECDSVCLISRVLIQRIHSADLQHIQHVDGEPTCFVVLLVELTAVFLSPFCAETVMVLPCGGFNSVSYLFFIPPACSPAVSRTRSPLTALPKGLSNSLQGALGLEGVVREAERERERGEAERWELCGYWFLWLCFKAFDRGE